MLMEPASNESDGAPVALLITRIVSNAPANVTVPDDIDESGVVDVFPQTPDAIQILPETS